MSQFEQMQTILNRAQRGEKALEWFPEVARLDEIQYKAAVHVAVHYGSATGSGKAARHYVELAFAELLPTLLEYAKRHAEADLEAGLELLK